MFFYTGNVWSHWSKMDQATYKTIQKLYMDIPHTDMVQNSLLFGFKVYTIYVIVKCCSISCYRKIDRGNRVAHSFCIRK